MKKFNIPFSPPDISDAEVELVADALRSGWITTGPKTKLLENFQGLSRLIQFRYEVLYEIGKGGKQLLES